MNFRSLSFGKILSLLLSVKPHLFHNEQKTIFYCPACKQPISKEEFPSLKTFYHNGKQYPICPFCGFFMTTFNDFARKGLEDD